MKYLNILLIILAIILAISCDMCNNGNGTKPPSIEQQIEEHLTNAWLEFEKSEYDSAEYYFDKILELDSELSEGSAGKAWSKLMKDEESFVIIEALFEKSKTDTSIIIDVLAGLAIVNNLQEKYTSSINYINEIHIVSESYVFQHKTDINYQDLLVIQAHSYFFNKQFDKSYESILQLTTQFVFDPDDSSTWIVEENKYPSYEGAISAALAIVSDLYKSF